MDCTNKVELLSPVGSFRGLLGAINAGADAVYLAGDKFGARAYAENFNEESLIEAIDVAHLFNVKVYLTVNTLFKESEIKELETYLSPLIKHNLDGVIVQDLGVLNLVRKLFPNLPIHASTQMSVCGPYAASFLQANGVTRIVPSRELSLEEIKDIIDTGVEVECFIHGAMCYCYSGQCLFSSILGGRSGNRGRCAQPCRLPYKSKGSKDYSYILSMKDMCTLDILPELIESGITSFKIEGRMKKPEYAAGVTFIYRKYIDEYYSKGQIHINKEDRSLLEQLYIRSQKSEGYYHRRNGREMITVDSPAYSETDEKVIETIKTEYIDKKPQLNIDAFCRFVLGESISLSYKYKDICVSVEGKVVEKALKSPISREDLISRLSKLGDTYFKVNNFEIQMDRDGFVPVGILNELRRECAQKLKERLING